MPLFSFLIVFGEAMPAWVSEFLDSFVMALLVVASVVAPAWGSVGSLLGSGLEEAWIILVASLGSSFDGSG